MIRIIHRLVYISVLLGSSCVAKKPTFDQLYLDLYGKEYDPDDNIVLNYSNPYDVRPVFKDFKHSNLVPDLFMEILATYEPKRPRFIVEVLFNLNKIVQFWIFIFVPSR